MRHRTKQVIRIVSPSWIIDLWPTHLNRVKTLTVSIRLPTSQRDLRLDLFRGLANWTIFLGHIPNTTLTWFSTRNYGFSDGADLFVLISGYTTAFVFAKVMLSRGFIIGSTRIYRHVWQIYVAHVLLLIIYLSSVHYLAHQFNLPQLIDQYNVGRLIDYPAETLMKGLVLEYKPLNLDVLPLFIVLLGAFPPILWLMLRYRNWILLGSVMIYLAARQFDWNLPSYPSGVWYFNPLTWQLLFVLGGWLALGGAQKVRFLVRSRLVLFFGVIFLLFSLTMTLSGQVQELQNFIPRRLFEVFNPNDKTDLALYRIVNIAILVLLTVRFMPIDWAGLRTPLFRPLIKCGQHSLEVFCVGVVLSFVASFVLKATSDAYLLQLLVGASGLSIMTGVAYYASWSKNTGKR